MSARKTREEFIEQAKKVHGDKYDYSKVEYNGAHEKVCIVCPQHGEFWQTPANHLSGKGCLRCCKKEKHTVDEFIEMARKVHGDKYDYSKVEYINSKTKVCIICQKHGEFWQTPNKHLSSKNGCPFCVRQSHDLESFVKKAKEVHGDKYDYSKVKYVNSKVKVLIVCPTHGEFWQTPNDHLSGVGCPKCNQSKLEREIKFFLDENHIAYNEQCGKGKLDWLGKQTLDFYLPCENIAIECQGSQHFKPVKMFGGDKGFKVITERDERKRNLCNEHGVKLLYYTTYKFDYPYSVCTSHEELLSKIKNEE